MSVRGQYASQCVFLTIPNITAVVARIRPLLDKELDKDTIVRAESSEEGKPMNVVRIPNPKNESEEFSFTFNGVYDMETTQEELFTNEGMVAMGGLYVLVLIDHSCASSQIAISRPRHYDLCIWSYWDGEDAHHARWVEAFGKRRYT